MSGLPTATAVAPLACGNCGQALQVLQLAGHYGRTVEIDLCAPCHLVWFDAIESARLAGPGLLDLIGAMAQAQSQTHELAHTALQASPPCPRCRGAVRAVFNRTRWGKSQQLECVHQHGAYQSFAQFLAEKGLLRPMTSADRLRAQQLPGGLHCVNCGGAIAQQDNPCSWCGSVPSLLDVARLVQALDPEGATRGSIAHQADARAGALACQACGAALPSEDGRTGWTCPQCQATVTTPGLAEAHRLVSALGPALRAHAQRPAPHVVRKRLAAQQGGLQRQRERAAEMQAEADAALGRRRLEADNAADAFSLLQALAGLLRLVSRLWR
jgi:Zn-finger nucleic acid-binding protein